MDTSLSPKQWLVSEGLFIDLGHRQFRRFLTKQTLSFSLKTLLFWIRLSGRLVLKTNGFQTTVKVMPSGTNFKLQTSETHGRGSLSKSLLLKMPSQSEMFRVPILQGLRLKAGQHLRQEWPMEPWITEERTQKHLLVSVLTWTHHQDAARLAQLPSSPVYCVTTGKRLTL